MFEGLHLIIGSLERPKPQIHVWVVLNIIRPFQGCLARVPYYFGDLKLENCPYSTLVETLRSNPYGSL